MLILRSGESWGRLALAGSHTWNFKALKKTLPSSCQTANWLQLSFSWHHPEYFHTFTFYRVLIFSTDIIFPQIFFHLRHPKKYSKLYAKNRVNFFGCMSMWSNTALEIWKTRNSGANPGGGARGLVPPKI